MKRLAKLVMLGMVLLILATGFGFASGQGDKAAAATGPVRIVYYHLDTVTEGMAYWQGLADQYVQTHPNVTIDITALENEAFKTKITTLMQSGTPPDIFQSWGGGVMAEYARAGLLRDITKFVQGTDWGKTMSPGVLGIYALDGKQYGVPYDMGAIGWWYNKDILAKAGYTEFPKTWPEFTAMITKIKGMGVIPIALGAGDKWPAMHMWAYMSMRLGGKAAYDKVLARTGKFTDEPFVKAAQMMVDLKNMNPFQPGFLGATYNDEAALVGNGEAAMELMGQWAPAVQKDSSVSKTGIGDKLAVAPFPSIPGGAGQVTDVTGGGNGYAVGKNAPDQAIDFLKYITSLEAQTKYAQMGRIIPTVAGAEVGIQDPQMKAIKSMVDKSTYYQFYLDQFFPPAVGGAVNDAVQGLLAGTLTPQTMTAAIQKAYEENR